MVPDALTQPRPVAADPDGSDCDVPATLTTRLAGQPDLEPASHHRRIDEMANALRAIHALRVPAGALGSYRPWNLHVVTAPPEWARAKQAWRAAIEAVRAGVPATAAVLCHRDFHPANVLWDVQGALSGVVDWTHACRGPAAVDVAHCRLNLAWLHGLDVADDFARAYGRVEQLASFDCVDAVGVGDGEPDAWRWHDGGRRDLTTDVLVGVSTTSSSMPSTVSGERSTAPGAALVEVHDVRVGGRVEDRRVAVVPADDVVQHAARLQHLEHLALAGRFAGMERVHDQLVADVRLHRRSLPCGAPPAGTVGIPTVADPAVAL